MDKRAKRHIFKKRISGLTRAALVAVAVILQLALMIVLVYYMQFHAIWLYFVIEIVSIILIFALVNDSEAYKKFWIIIVLAVPVVGFFLYAMWGRKRTNSRGNRHFREVDTKMLDSLKSDTDVLDKFRQIHPNKVQISRYLSRQGFPLYENTKVSYYGLGEQMRDALFEDIRNAKSYIFLEYFIISDGVFWQELYELLKQKVREGVEVRLLMDDFGCIFINTREFREDLRKNGITFAEFAPIHKDISRISFNYRNHQ